MRQLLVAVALGAIAAQHEQPSLPLVDHHQHFFSPAYAARVNVASIDAGLLIGHLDAAGIRRAAVLSVAYGFSNPNRPPIEDDYAAVRSENDWTSREVARFADRLRGFCSVNPLRTYATEEIARCAKDPGLRTGLKLHFGNSDVRLENPEHVAKLRAVFAAANAHRMAIVVHLRSTISQQRPYGKEQARSFLNDVLAAAPDVPVQIAHMAGAGGFEDPLVDQALSVFIDAIAARDAKMSRVYFDVSGVVGFTRDQNLDLIANRIRQVGIERVLYGSDAATPTIGPREAWAAFRKLPLSAAEFQTIAANVAPYMK